LVYSKANNSIENENGGDGNGNGNGNGEEEYIQNECELRDWIIWVSESQSIGEDGCGIKGEWERTTLFLFQKFH